MKVAIIGSRTFTDYDRLEKICNSLDITEVISGGAIGADYLGKYYANEYNIKYTEFPADWDKHGKKAGYLRNIDIVNAADIVLAFWDGKSKGTKHSIDLARKQNKLCVIFHT